MYNLSGRQLQTEEAESVFLNGERLSSNNASELSYDMADTECSAVKPPKRFKYQKEFLEYKWSCTNIFDPVVIQNESESSLFELAGKMSHQNCSNYEEINTMGH